MNETSANDKHVSPEFGDRFGFLYPLAWRLLSTNRYWSPSMWFNRKSALVIDIYVCAWWTAEMLLAVLCARLAHWQGWLAWVCVALFSFRFVDICFVLLSILLKGFYRRPGDWLSANRLVLLVLINSVEITFIFAVLYRALAFLVPNAAEISTPFSSLFESLYFSVVTATTLGYGTPHPTGWLSRFMSILETLTMFLIVITLVGYFAGRRRPSKDLETEQTETRT